MNKILSKIRKIGVDYRSRLQKKLKCNQTRVACGRLWLIVVDCAQLCNLVPA